MGLRGFEWVEERGWECENPLWGRLAARLFHVLRHPGDALDTVRKSEYARLAGQDRSFIKGQKYTLLAHRANLTLEGKKSLKLLLAANKRLNTAYLLKETFGQLRRRARISTARAIRPAGPLRVSERRAPSMRPTVGRICSRLRSSVSSGTSAHAFAIRHPWYPRRVGTRDARRAEVRGRRAIWRSGFFERDQFEAVRRRLRPDLRVAVSLAYTFGWRVEDEVLTLERRHVDLGAGTIRLDPGSTKNDDGRVVYLTPALTEAITVQIERVKTLERTLGRIIPWLFPHLGKLYRGQRIKECRRAWRTACRRAGLPGKLLHDFRRTAARNLVNAGVPERVAMQVTGHRTRSVFDRYHIVSPGDLQEASRRLAAHHDGQRTGKGRPRTGETRGATS